MGTRSTIKFYDENSNEPLLSVYQQYDGHLYGVGCELAKFLKSKTIINGISDQTMKAGFANGLGCLAAQYVAEKKTKIGEFYLTTKHDKQEYNYKVFFINGEFIIEVEGFTGTPDELLASEKQ